MRGEQFDEWLYKAEEALSKLQNYDNPEATFVVLLRLLRDLLLTWKVFLSTTE